MLALIVPSLVAQVDLGAMSAFGLIAVVVLVLGLIVLGMVAIYGKLWFQGYMSGADVSFPALIGMGFRQVNPRTIMNAKIMAAQAGLGIDRRSGISTSRLEAHYLAAGGSSRPDSVLKVINAIIVAQRRHRPRL